MRFTSGLRGSFDLDEKTVDQEVGKISPGTFTLGYKKDGTYYVKFVGRSDTDVRAQLKQYIGQYDRFKFGFFNSPQAAFVKECELYHGFGGSEGKIDNKKHPETLQEATRSCPRCSVGNSQHTGHTMRALSSTRISRPRNLAIAAIVLLTLLNLVQFSYMFNLSASSRQLQSRYEALYNQQQTLTTEYEQVKQAKQAALIPPYAQISKGVVEWVFYDLHRNIIHWKLPVDKYRDYVSKSKPVKAVTLKTGALTVSTYDVRSYIQPAFFQNVISNITQGRTDSEFVKEVDNIKNQIVGYGEELSNAPYRFPAETLTEGNGNCADSTILMASMLAEGNQIANYHFKVYVWYVQLVNHSFLSDLQSITGVNHAIVEVEFSNGDTWNIETTTKEFYLYPQVAGWKYDVTMISEISQGSNDVKTADSIVTSINPQQKNTTTRPTLPSLTLAELQYLTSKYGNLLSTVGILLFSIDLATLSSPCGSFGIHNNDFMIGYCYVNRYGSSGIVWNYLHGPNSFGFIVLMDYPTAVGTWHSIQGAPNLYKSYTSILPPKMNGAYGHAYVFVEEPNQ